MGIRTISRLFIWFISAVFFFAVLVNIWVILSTRGQIKSPEEIKGSDRTALILGTSYLTREGASNPFFTSRITTGIKLFRNKRVNDFLLSGSATEYYNEPRAMARSLQEAGIPANILTSDTLGVRTLSSIIRCKEVYKKDRIVIITQNFHAYRALFISNFYNLEAVAIPTDDVNVQGTTGLVMREFFARPLAVIDLYLLNRRP